MKIVLITLLSAMDPNSACDNGGGNHFARGRGLGVRIQNREHEIELCRRLADIRDDLLLSITVTTVTPRYLQPQRTINVTSRHFRPQRTKYKKRYTNYNKAHKSQYMIYTCCTRWLTCAALSLLHDIYLLHSLVDLRCTVFHLVDLLLECNEKKIENSLQCVRAQGRRRRRN